MKKENHVVKQQICMDANSAASRSKFLHFKSILTILALCLCMVMGGEAWGQVVSGTTYQTKTPGSMPTGWSTNAETQNNNYLKLFKNKYIQTSEFCQNGFTRIVLKARKYGGPSDAEALITVSWYDATANAETVLGTVSPSSTTLSDYPISSPNNPTGNRNGYIKIQCKGAKTSKGSGVSQVTINYTACGSTPCTPTWDSDDYGYISNFTVTQGGSTLLNSSSTGTANSNTDYYSSRSITAAAGSTINLSITPSGSSDTYGFAVWIDFDADGMETSDMVLNTSTYVDPPYSGSYTIPANTPAGEYRLRILQDYYIGAPSNPCGSYNYGESEDYKLIVTAPVYYTVTYNGNGSTGGTPPTDAGSYLPGASATVLGNTGSLVKTGYTFGGWNTRADGNGTTYAAGDNLTVAGNTILYALWLSPYTVTWSIDGTTTTQNYPIGGSYALTVPSGVATDATSYNCYDRVFVGWTANSSYSSDNPPADLFITPSGNVSASVTYYAVFAYEVGGVGEEIYSFAGGTSADLLATGATASGLGSDYAVGNAPYRVKFDNTGDYIVIPCSSTPTSFTIEVKMIGGSTSSTLTIQASTNGTDYADVQSFATSGAQDDVLSFSTTNDFPSGTRYVKIYFTKGSNVGVGPISIRSYSYSGYSTTCVAPSCPRPTAFAAGSITVNSAQLSWTAGGSESSWQVVVSSSVLVDPSTGDVHNVAVASYPATGLSGNTTYYAYVRASCGGSDYSTWQQISFTTLDPCPVVGTGTTYSNTYGPVNPYYKYGYRQIIYPASSLYAGLITSVWFQYQYSSAMTSKDDVTIYMGTTTKNAFSSTTDWIAIGTLTQVYSGSLNCSSGWNEFTLTTPFFYDGTDNLVLAIDDNSFDYDIGGSSYAFYYSTGSGNVMIYQHSDSDNRDPVSPGSGTTTLYYPNTKFCISECTPLAGSLSLSSASGSLLVGNTLNLGLGAGILSENIVESGTISYSTSNDLVATVTAGVVNAVAEGTAYITITFTPDDGSYCQKSITYTVIVTDGCARIGNGSTSSSSGIKGGIYTYYNYYAYTQQVYTASEIIAAGGGAGVVNEIALNYNETTPSALTFEVYLGQTSQNSVPTSWISDAGLTLVYSGTKTFSEGWNSIDISSHGWEWDGSSNIVVAIRRTSKDEDAVSYPDFYHTNSTGMSCYYYNSSSSVILDGSNVATESGTQTSERPEMKFCIEMCTQPTGTFEFTSAIERIDNSATLNLALPAYFTNTISQSGTVTYSSSNHTVADIDNAGMVTASATAHGIAVITATFTPDNDDYCDLTATITIEVACSYSSPVCFDFEDATANAYYYQDAGMPGCWGRIYTGTYANGAPHAYNGEVARDGKGIVITSGYYDYYSQNYGTTNYVVFPYISGLNAGDLVNFNAWWHYVDYGTLTLGYMTDPNDAATFTAIDNATPFLYNYGSATTGTNQIELPAMPSGAYLAFRWYCATDYYSYDVVIDNICICSAVAGTFSLNTTSGTVLSMNSLDISGYINSTIDTDETPGTIVYSSSDDDIARVDANGVITGVAEGETTIIVSFVPTNTAKCPRYTTFTVTVNDGCAKLGDGGSNTTYQVPVNNLYKYTYTQILYSKNELTAGLITAIGFEYGYSSPMTAKNGVKLYLLEVDKTAFTAENDWVTTVTEENLVYSGTLNCSEGWNTFNLDEPFVYSGTHDLLLVIDDNSDSYNSSSYVFKYTTTTNKTVIYYTSDSNNLDNTGLGSQNASGFNTKRPNTKFCIYNGALRTITYNTTVNCTGGVASSVSCTQGVEGYTAFVTSDVPTCSTGVFQEWNTSDDGTGTSYAPGATILVGSSDITLYAIYRICDYVIVSRNGQPAQGANDGGYDSDGIQKFNVCLGSDLNLIASKKDGVAANFTTFLWDVNRHNGDVHLTSNTSTLSYTIGNAMGHDILLTVEADDGCKQELPLRVWVSDGLTMAGDSPTAGEICVGAGKEIYVGDPQVVPQSIIEVDNEAVEIKSTKGQADTKFIPDGVGECYTSDVEFADFKENVTITDASNIDYVRINLEHSHIGDMQISLKCYTPDLQERTAILLQDQKSTSGDGLDNASYSWPYNVIECYATFKVYRNNGDPGECSKGTYEDQEDVRVYVIKNGDTYGATGIRQEATSFDKNIAVADALTYLRGMISSGNTPADFCIDDEYYEFSSWNQSAGSYTTSNHVSSGSYGSYEWSCKKQAASLGFGKPNLMDGRDANILNQAYNPYGEGLDYCWSNSDSYTYADGGGYVIETVNHMDGYTNGKIVKPSDVAGGTQFYHPYQSFQSLVGCKLNGVWTIQICDSWGLDNGYIFSWEIGLKNVDDNAWSYDVSLVDSHVGTCGGFDPDDRYNTENLISEIEGESNFYIHPTIANVASLPVTIGATRNCELTLIDNIGCETTGNGFTYTVVQPTVPEITVPSICIGEETTVTADLTTGAVAGPGSSFTWWRTKDGNKTLIDSETGITSSSLSILPTTTDSIYSAEIYDAAGCGGIIDGVVTINVPDDVTDVADYNYIWHGKYINATSSDWNSPTNWILYNPGTSTYTVSSVNIPTIGDNVYIGSAKCGRTNPELTAESFANDLTIASPATLTIPADMTLNIAGDLTNTGTMTANNTSTVVFKGSDDQNISNAQSFGNVTFSQQATGHTINATNGITVNNKATFTQGVLKGNAEFASTATVNDPDNMTYNSFVDGTVTRTTSAAGEFTFPTGSGSVLGTVKASLPASSTIGATFYHSSGTGFDMPDADLCADNSPRLDHVSSHEYWKINTSSSLSSATLKVSSSNPGDHFTIPGATTYEGSHIYGTILQGGCWKTISRTPSEVNGDHNTITISDVNIPAVSMRAEPQPMSLGSTTSSTLLPIELTAFSATCDGRSSLVEWTTASERNNDYFSLEHSDDAINFTEIARIAGAGNSIEPLSYSYTDYGVRGGDNYYRLVQVDYDGTRTASEIVVANCIEASGEPEVLAYPNPFSGDLTVELENFGDRPARIDVYDMLGRLVYTEEVGAPQNSYQTVLHFGNLPDATYTVRVGTADFVINRKVVKQQ